MLFELSFKCDSCDYYYCIKYVVICHERPLVLKGRFYRHGLFLIDVCTTCYERPPVLRDRFCCAEEVVSQDWFFCTYIYGILSELNVLLMIVIIRYLFKVVTCITNGVVLLCVSVRTEEEGGGRSPARRSRVGGARRQTEEDPRTTFGRGQRRLGR